MASATVGALVMCLGCGDAGATVESEAELSVEPGAQEVTFAPLVQCGAVHAESDVVLSRPAAAQLDVIARPDGPWAVIGSFYSGREAIGRMAGGVAGGRAIVVVTQAGDDVTLLTNDLARPHRLRPPVRVDSSGGHTLALGDLDEDGSAELVLGRDDRLMIVDELEHALLADPEHPPDFPDEELARNGPFEGVAIADVDEDGALDVAAIRDDGQEILVFPKPRNGRDAESPREIPVSAGPVTDLLATSCDGMTLAVVRLEGGRLARVAGSRLVDVEVGGSVRRVFPGPDALVLEREVGELIVVDGCFSRLTALGVDGEDVASASVTLGTLGIRRVALLSKDGETVRLLRIADSD